MDCLKGGKPCAHVDFVCTLGSSVSLMKLSLMVIGVVLVEGIGLRDGGNGRMWASTQYVGVFQQF